MRRTSRPSVLALAVGASLIAAPIFAQPRPAPRGTAVARGPAAPRGPASPGGPGAPARPLTLREATALLQSANNDEVLQGIDALTRLGTPDVVPPLVELVHRGVPDELLETVISKLGIIGQPAAIEELSALLRHRRPTVRRAAVEALGQIRDPRTRALVESGLRDSDSTVRGTAATSLGTMGARASVELLQRAFERSVPEAAEAIGRLGDPAAATRLLESVGRAQLSVLLPAFRRFLDRRDIADPVKLNVIEQLVSRSPTVQVKRFLQDWLDHLPPGARTPSRTRAELAVRQIRDDATAPPAPAAPSAAPAGGAR